MTTIIAVTRHRSGETCTSCGLPIEPGRHAVLTRDGTGRHTWLHLRCLITNPELRTPAPTATQESP